MCILDLPTWASPLSLMSSFHTSETNFTPMCGQEDGVFELLLVDASKPVKCFKLHSVAIKVLLSVVKHSDGEEVKGSLVKPAVSGIYCLKTKGHGY